jgi:hypothetical protein
MDFKLTDIIFNRNLMTAFVAADKNQSHTHRSGVELSPFKSCSVFKKYAL